MSLLHAFILGIVEDFFSPEEKKAWKCCSPESQLDLFYRFWVRKEAIVKAMGTGLAFPLHELDVSDLSQYPVRLHGVGCEELSLTVADIEVQAPYVASVCLKRIVRVPEGPDCVSEMTGPSQPSSIQDQGLGLEQVSFKRRP